MPAPHKFGCPFCLRNTKFSFLKYCQHLQLFHEHEINFKLTCGFENCQNSFKRVSGYKRHYYRIHKTKLNETNFLSDESDNEIESDHASESDICEDDEDLDLLENAHVTSEEVQSDVLTHLANFVLKIKEKHLLPVTVQESLIDETKFLVNFVTEKLQVLVKQALSQFDLEDEQLNNLLDNQFIDDVNVWEKIASSYHFDKFIRDNFPVVKPQSYSLSMSEPNKYTFHYIPVTQVLEVLLESKDVGALLLRQQEGLYGTDVLLDVCDGTAIRKNSFFSSEPGVIPLHFYVDEFEVCNPIGAKRGKYKMTAVYFTIGSLPLVFRSLQQSIYLCLLVRHPFLKQHDPHYAKLMQPLIADLKSLQEGIGISRGGNMQTVKAGIATVSGDNLSAHALGGFQVHFNSGRVCRSCTVDHKELGKSFDSADFVARDSHVYNYELRNVLEYPEESSVYGIKYRCIFSDLDYFSVPDGFPPDIMHDCLEGVIPSTVSLVLRNLHGKGKFTLEEFNNALLKVKIPTTDRPNKINETVLKGKSKISGTASQKWELFINLAQIVQEGSFDVAGEPAWEVYLALRECLDYIFSPVVEKKTVKDGTVKDAISAFLFKLTDTFGIECLTPKHHYLVHYPEHMLKFGPLRNIWCMRFESKHQYFKKLSSVLRNFINITHTLTHRHQMKQAYELSGQQLYPLTAIPMSRSKQIKLEKLPILLARAIMDKCEIEISEDVELVSSVKIAGITYEKSGCYVLDVVEEENIPYFLLVHNIVHVNNSWFLCGKMYRSTGFIHDYHCYQVEADALWYAIEPKQLLDSRRHRFYDVDGINYAITLFHVTKSFSLTH